MWIVPHLLKLYDKDGVLSVGDYGGWSVICLTVFTEHLLCVKAHVRQSVPPSGSPANSRCPLGQFLFSEAVSSSVPMHVQEARTL